MHLQVTKDEIIDGLQKAANILPMKTGAAYLRTIWLRSNSGRLEILATDSSFEFTGTYSANIMKPGTVGVQGKNFSELIRRLPSGEITLRQEKEGGPLSIEQGRRKYKLPTSDAAWFQPFTPFPQEESVLWSGDFLKELIERIAFCTSDEESMMAMSCVNFSRLEQNGVEVCGLNGHQFATVEFKNPELYALIPENGFLISKKHLLEIRRLISGDEIEINLKDNKLFIRSDKQKEVLSVPLSSYIFPDYKKILSQYENQFESVLTINRQELINSLNRILLFNTAANKATILQLQPNDIAISSQGQDAGEACEHVTATYTGTLDSIALNTKSILDILSHFTGKEIRFEFSGAFSPCQVTSKEEENYIVVTMPVEIVEETFYPTEEEK